MKYIVRPRREGNGSFSVAAADPKEALDYVKGLVERGVEDVEVLDESGTPYALDELERIASEAASS